MSIDSPQHPPRHRHILRRLLLHAALGIVLTYAVTAFAVLVLPIPTMSFRVRGMRIHRAEFPNSQPFLRLRIWSGPYGSYFQIHRTTQRGIALSYGLDPNDPEQFARTPENPKLDDPTFIPSWSKLRAGWPAPLAQLEEPFKARAYWYELRMGWPFPCLHGGFCENEASDGGRMWSKYGVVPITRRAWYWGPFHKLPTTVGMPLIPDWLPFLACVAFYGALSFAVPIAWRAGRRALAQRRYRRRGRCTQCGYDLRGSPERCPECGFERQDSSAPNNGIGDSPRSSTG